MGRMIRVDKDTYNVLKNIQANMNMDLNKITGKKYCVPLGKVIKLAVVENENWIKVPLNKLPEKFARRIRLKK